MSTIFTIYPSRLSHSIYFRTKKGRTFILDIGQNTLTHFDSEVTVLDPLPPRNGSWFMQTNPQSSSAADNFSAGVSLILDYLKHVDATDGIEDIHNPCNTPFVDEKTQNFLLKQAGVSMNVRVN